MDDELVFEGRNQSYGAYALRKSYTDNMSKGMLIAFAVLSGVLLAFLFSSSNNRLIIEDRVENTEVVMLTDQDIERARVIPEEPPKTVQTSAPAIDQIRFVEPLVVVDNADKIESTLPTQSILINAVASSVTSDGVEGGAIISNNGNTNPSNGSGGEVKPSIPNENTGDVFDIVNVQKKPSYPGGDAALFKYLSENIKYPILARENHIEGRCVLQFIVSKTGNIEHIKVIRPVEGGCTEEAIKVVNKMPLWEPGESGGKPVSVKYTLPIMFRLTR